MNDKLNWKEAFDEALKGDRKLLDQKIKLAYEEIILPAIKPKIRNISESKDLANEVILKFWDRFYVVGEPLPQNVNGYLYTMATNKVYKHTQVQSKLKVNRVDLDDVNFKCVLNKITAPDDSEEMNEKESKYQAIERAVAQLCNTCKKIVQFCYFERRKLKDCYQELGIPSANAASKKKVNCLKKLIKFTYKELREEEKINQLKIKIDYA